MSLETLLIPLIKISLVVGGMVGVIMYLIFLERKVAAWIQDRVGPNRVGPMGLLHAVADGLKLLFKEDVVPPGVDRPLYLLAPVVILIPALCTIAVVPFGDVVELFGYHVRLQIADVNIGVLYILAVASLGVYGIVLGGWSSNSKYAFLGGIRSAAQLLSYEVPLGLSLLGVILLAGSLQLDEIVYGQTGAFFWRWNIFVQPLAFVVFLTCAFAETNRAPFDVAEAEQELVAGYHTEYSSMKWAMFFLAEYANMIVSSAVMATLFFGGWHFPFLAEPTYVPGPDGALIANPDNLLGDGLPAALVKIGVFCAKVGLFLFLFMWVRWTLPRFKFDQLMGLAWKVLVPLAMANLVVVGLVLYAGAVADPHLTLAVRVVLFVLNVVGFVMILFVIPWLSKSYNARFGGPDSGAGPRAGSVPAIAGR
jgi:NADH-quinone oxidoreductase subunit H